MPELVYMTHPNVEGTAGPVTRQAFEEVWKSRDWVEAQPAAAAASEALGAEVADLGALRKDELIEVARSSGLEVDPTATKAELVALIESVTAPAAESKE